MCGASRRPRQSDSHSRMPPIRSRPDHDSLGEHRPGVWLAPDQVLCGDLSESLMVRERLPGDGEQAGQEERAWVIWLSCGGCEGCTMSVLGATSPRLEELLGGGLTHVPRIEFIHPALSL